MPIEIGLWKLGAQLEPIRFQPLEVEKKLEDALATNLSLVGEGVSGRGSVLRIESSGLLLNSRFWWGISVAVFWRKTSQPPSGVESR